MDADTPIVVTDKTDDGKPYHAYRLPPDVRLPPASHEKLVATLQAAGSRGADAGGVPAWMQDLFRRAAAGQTDSAVLRGSFRLVVGRDAGGRVTGLTLFCDGAPVLLPAYCQRVNVGIDAASLLPTLTLTFAVDGLEVDLGGPVLIETATPKEPPPA